MFHWDAGEGFFGGFGWGDFGDGVFVGGVVKLGGPPVEEGFDGTVGGVESARVAGLGEVDEVLADEGGGEVFDVGGGLGGAVGGEVVEFVGVVLEGARGALGGAAIGEEGDGFG